MTNPQVPGHRSARTPFPVRGLPSRVSTPEESLELALDETADRERRAAAIGQLRTANECDGLAAVATGDVPAELRRRAVEAMGEPQCEEMLAELLEDDELSGDLRERAEQLVREGAEDDGPRLS